VYTGVIQLCRTTVSVCVCVHMHVCGVCACSEGGEVGEGQQIAVTLQRRVESGALPVPENNSTRKAGTRELRLCLAVYLSSVVKTFTYGQLSW
jgi:hypothetical protein